MPRNVRYSPVVGQRVSGCSYPGGRHDQSARVEDAHPRTVPDAGTPPQDGEGRSGPAAAPATIRPVRRRLRPRADGPGCRHPLRGLSRHFRDEVEMASQGRTTRPWSSAASATRTSGTLRPLRFRSANRPCTRWARLRWRSAVSTKAKTATASVSRTHSEALQPDSVQCFVVDIDQPLTHRVSKYFDPSHIYNDDFRWEFGQNRCRGARTLPGGPRIERNTSQAPRCQRGPHGRIPGTPVRDAKRCREMLDEFDRGGRHHS